MLNEKEIRYFDRKKSVLQNDIPVKIKLNGALI